MISFLWMLVKVLGLGCLVAILLYTLIVIIKVTIDYINNENS